MQVTANRESFVFCRFHCTLAIPRKIQEDLLQSITISDNQWKIVLQAPDNFTPGFAIGRLDENPQFVEQTSELDARQALIRRWQQFHF